ncbi:TrmH family RNA methyltransferase, partial [Staphylococcus sp. GDY8P97P]
SEGEGMSRLVKDKCDFYIKLPMVGHVNSLNASVAASLLMYEVYRKRHPIGQS